MINRLCLTTADVAYAQSITGISSTQAAALSFRTALMDTVASVLAVPSSTVRIWKIAHYIGSNGSGRVTYSTSVRSSKNSSIIISILDKAVSDRSFASTLSTSSGIPLLSVKGNYTRIESSAAILAPETSPGNLRGL